jgi:hypothetical protein
MVGGKIEKLYHEKMTISTNKETTNAYIQHLQSDRKLALKFFDKDEALRVIEFFKNRCYRSAKVIKY